MRCSGRLAKQRTAAAAAERLFVYCLLSSGGLQLPGLGASGSSTTEETYKANLEALMRAYQKLKKLKLSDFGYELPAHALNMEFSGDLPPNSNGLKLRNPIREPLSKIEEAGGSVRDLYEVEDLVYDSSEANIEMITRRLNNRDRLAKLPSGWSKRGSEWWRRVPTIVGANSGSLAVHFMETYRQAINHHYDYAASSSGKAVSFTKMWRRMIHHHQHKNTTMFDLRAVSGVVFPVFRPKVSRTEIFSKYLIEPPLHDWVRHPDLLPAEPALTQYMAGKRSKKTLELVNAKLDEYEQNDLYYNVMSWRLTQLRAEGFQYFSETKLAPHAEQLKELGVKLPVLLRRSGAGGGGVLDFAWLTKAGVDEASVGKLTAWLTSLKIEKRVEAALSKSVLSKSGRAVLKHLIFDSRKLEVLRNAEKQLALEMSLPRGVDDRGLSAFAFRLAVTRAVHKWFEEQFVPALLEDEPRLESVAVPLKVVESYDKTVACAADALIRMDTNELAPLVLKYLINEPTPMVRRGRKVQSCRLRYNAASPAGPHTLQSPVYVKDLTEPAFALFRAAPAAHVAFHVYDPRRAGSYVAMPGFQEWYTRYDEVQTTNEQRAFTGHVVHLGLNKEAADLTEVFSVFELRPEKLKWLTEAAATLSAALRKQEQPVDSERAPADPEDVDDAEAVAQNASYRRNPLVRELAAIGKGSDPFARRGLISKGIYEILGWGFHLIAPPKHVLLKRRGQDDDDF